MLRWPSRSWCRNFAALLSVAVLALQQEPPTSTASPLPANTSCGASPRLRQPTPGFQHGSLHDVVGEDGVLVISFLRKPERFAHSSVLLEQAGIWPTEFPAVDAACVEKEELQKACTPIRDHERVLQTCQGKQGRGCASEVEQAIAESHRRALEAALKRSSDWTAILEEDVVPVRPARWSAAFQEAWQRVPAGVKIVRLSWCNFPGDHEGYVMGQDTFADTGDFLLSNWTGYYSTSPTEPPGRVYNSGGCTGGYVVHRSIIPELLKLFPCCCAWDCCLEYDYYENPLQSEGVPGGAEEVPRGMQIMLNMDAWGSIEYAMNYTFWGLYQSGVLVQDTRDLPSSRDEQLGKEAIRWNTEELVWKAETPPPVAVT